jgi:hypothetical protein
MDELHNSLSLTERLESDDFPLATLFAYSIYD